MASKKQVAKVETKAVVGWADRVKQAASRQMKAAEFLGGVSPWISFKGGLVQVNGAVAPNGTLNCIVLSYLQERAYYEKAYDANSPQSPDCWGYGDEENNAPLAPHAKAKTKQHDECKTCEWAQYGSADKGRGQACRQSIRLALVPATDEGVNGPLFFARVPPTSIKHVTSWLNALGDTPWFTVMTEIKVTPSTNNMFDVTMTPKAQIPPAFQGPILAKLGVVETELRTPYPDFEDTPAPVAPSKGKKRGKF